MANQLEGRLGQFSGKIGRFVIGFSPIGEPVLSPDQPGVTNVIPSYLYYWYRDDDDLQAFVASFNQIAQTYVNWFNQVGLPYYPGPVVSGGLLDWVALGLYGMPRPVLASGRSQWVGALNTWELNSIPLNQDVRTGSANYYVVDDDYFRRILTWHLYKGDGKYFNIRWLKRRVWRFLFGQDGLDVDTGDTSQVGVTFGIDQGNIILWFGRRDVTGGGTLNSWELNSRPINSVDTSVTYYREIPNVKIFIDAVNSGALELPFQWSWVVTVINPTDVTGAGIATANPTFGGAGRFTAVAGTMTARVASFTATGQTHVNATVS